MAIPNETPIMSGNGGASSQAQSAKKKVAQKSGSSIRDQVSAAAKRLTSRSSGPVEILFTQEPNPYRQPAPPFIWIDFPIQNEVLRAPTYVIRLGVGGTDLVEISIDKSPWLPCRLTSGYWWYDWATIARGKHTLVARMRTPDGRWFKTPLRQCDYRPE
jgi:hypothetical protein